MSKLQAFIDRRAVVCFTVVAVLLCSVATVALQGRDRPELLETANKLGPAAQSLVQGRGLAVCYGADGNLNCFHAERMPVAPLTIAGLYLLFHDHGLAAALTKTLLFLVPVLLAFALIWRAVAGSATWIRWAVFGLFIAALLLPPTLDLAANLNFEEAYFYGWLLLAVTLLLFAESWRHRPWPGIAVMLVSLTLIYMTKSATLPACGFLAAMTAVFLWRSLNNVATAAAVLLLFACVPLSWGAYQHHVSGRFTLGTSLDGVNLYKGNNPFFLEHYPAFRGASLDDTEAELLEGKVSMDDEWAVNDFARHAALEYMRTHPSDTLQAGLRKASVFFLGVRRNESDESYGGLVQATFAVGLVLFRLLLLCAMLLGLQQLFARSGARFAALVFVGTVACTALPYVAGFALTRHPTVLILPAAAYLCRVLVNHKRNAASQALLA